MKSSFLEKSKRALVLLLTGAMIATSVPSTAFAATVADEDVIIEEATDAVAEDAVVEEEVVADEPSEAVEALGAEEPVDEDADTVEADDAGQVRELVFDASATGIMTADGTVATATDNDDFTFVTTASAADVETITIPYGREFTDITATVELAGGSAYNGTKMNWALYELKETKTDSSVNKLNEKFAQKNDTVTKRIADAYDTDLTAYGTAKTAYYADATNAKLATLLETEEELLTNLVETTAPSGLTIAPKATEDADSAIITIHGPGVKQVSDGFYVIKAWDDDNPVNAVYSEIIEIKVTDIPTIGGIPGGTANQY